MKNQSLNKVKIQLEEMVSEQEAILVKLNYKLNCVQEAIIILEENQIHPHEPGRGKDNKTRRKRRSGLGNTILNIIGESTKYICSREILDLVRLHIDHQEATLNSVSGLLTLFIQQGRLQRIKKQRKFYYKEV